MAFHNELGKRGEKIAAEYILKKGYTILTKNWRFGKDEIDIIAIDKSDLVIIEVKTRSNNYFGDPQDAVDFKKETFMIRAAEAYVEIENIDYNIRYDIIAIIINNTRAIINHTTDAFYPSIS
ncbi:MAG: YraN family protein [Bacteroidales bacterium]|nr:YraN family protein [Bacteroidales bacterium]MDG2081182.1 YraN family protein [Bacteroidales bacterium]|tara:strand:+ start:296 stop:661 length:366 start_codon:yes stop_codon:yes gene_type:complete